MLKKLLMAFMALTALTAFAMPASAVAANDPQLTHAGVLVPVGTKLIATNTGDTLFTTTGKAELVRCTKAVLTGTVLKNAGGTVEGTMSTADFTGTAAGGKCKSSFGGDTAVKVSTPLCMRSTPLMVNDEFQIYGDDCTGENKPVTFTLETTNIGTCKYRATPGGVKGHFTTSPEEAKGTVTNTQSGSGAELEEGGFFCPSSGQLEMTFDLYTDTAAEESVTIS